MYKQISLEDARSAFNDNYTYEPIPGGRFRATAIEHASDIDDLRLVFPDSVPLDEDGRPFAPGCSCMDLTPHHEIFSELQLSPKYAQISIDTGIFRKNENDDYEFEFIAPDAGADDALLIVSWDGYHVPPMKGLTCRFARKFGAKYFARSEPEKNELEAELNTFGVDVWIIPRQAALTDAFREIAKDDRWRIAAGDIFAATYEQTAPYFREHMEEVLYPAIQAVNPHIVVEFGDDYADAFSTASGKTQIGRYSYTLKGAQKFVYLAKKRKCRIANGDPSDLPVSVAD